jgi:hypothetical protein
MDTPNTVTPSNETIKLIIDNSLLEQEKRISKTINDTLSEQNRTYMTEIISLTKELTKLSGRVDAHDTKIKSFPILVSWVAAACAALGGLVGFFVNQLVK